MKNATTTSGTIILLEKEQLKELVAETVRETIAQSKEFETNPGFSDRWYNLNELSNLLGKSKRTILDIVKQNGLKKSQIGRSYYFKASDIEELLNEGYRK